MSRTVVSRGAVDVGDVVAVLVPNLARADPFGVGVAVDEDAMTWFLGRRVPGTRVPAVVAHHDELGVAVAVDVDRDRILRRGGGLSSRSYRAWSR